MRKQYKKPILQEHQMLVKTLLMTSGEQDDADLYYDDPQIPEDAL